MKVSDVELDTLEITSVGEFSPYMYEPLATTVNGPSDLESECDDEDEVDEISDSQTTGHQQDYSAGVW